MSHDAPTFDPDAQRGRRTLVVVARDGFFARELPAEGSIVIGRALECDVRIDDAAVSRRHAVIECGPSLVLTAVSKTGRTRVDGRDVPVDTPKPLELGQVLEIGDARLVVRREVPTRTADGVELAAKSDLPVLVLGETGAGKELAMERIVSASRRRDATHLRIDCASAGDAELDLARANDGTVFLDEVAELSPAMQAKLLGAIDAQGESGPRPRVIAATNRDIRTLVARGAFREDLYYRLAGVIVTVPPLRDRADELPELARAILGELAAREHRGVPAISEAATALLVAYRWPGNVRELRHVLARALHTAKEVIEPAHVDLMPPTADAAAPAPASVAPSSVAPASEAEVERARIVAALAKANGNQKEAARLLGMTRRMLMYRLDAYGIPRPRKGGPS